MIVGSRSAALMRSLRRRALPSSSSSSSSLLLLRPASGSAAAIGGGQHGNQQQPSQHNHHHHNHHHHHHRRFKSTLSLDERQPTLVEVPSLPVVGSMWTRYSGMPEMDQTKVFDFWPEMRRRYGDFYSFGLPGLGRGLNGTTHVIQDPVEMAKIVRQEGKFPGGAAEFSWAMKSYLKDRGATVAGLLSHGPEWKRVRTFVQTDLLAPASAQRYLPLVVEAAPSISRGAPAYADRMNAYLNLASFEMFSNVMLGDLPRVLDPTHETSEEDVQFCEHVANALRINSQMMQSTYEPIASKLGIKTKLYREFENSWDIAQEISQIKVEKLMSKRESGKPLTPNEEACYTNVAFDRAASGGDGDITVEEAKTVVGGLLSAGVDTTGGLLSFKLLHIACSPEAQGRIHDELLKNGCGNGKVTPEAVSSANAPYLHACLRESHRLANSNVMIPMKMMPKQVTVHGVDLPPNSVVVLDGYSTGVDPDLLEDPMEFKPERFLKDAVEARKGTPSQVVDHVFFSGPFSQGARKCPGSRVANLETAVLIAQLVLDWEMSVPGVRHWTEVPYALDTVTTAQLPAMEFAPRRGR